ncbi:eukaryotic and archaeal DNA primase, large subunit-domain-containing protein [Phycomyces blakesleeanus]|uniref:Eukaryotic and archaeal DNA primase, large subunit-domain-containing protein n=1 Tax=Phycomyces blakesleeanus TaxID=4837 RepID=A0ABR3B810_PHYBL
MSNSLEKQSDVSDTDIEYTPERITLSDDSVPEPYELSQFDLDIVDDALQNPHSSEFCDHFGFTIQVQTDDEATSSSESEGEDDDQNSISDATRLDQPDSSVQDYRRHDNPGPPEKKYPKKKPAVLRTDTHSRRTSINIERPSQVYQERQSKRLSEIYKTAVEASPAAPSYYDMLKAKFGKPTQENVHPRETPRQIALKEETASSLKSLKDTNNDYDWEFWASVISGFDEMVKSDVQNLRLHLAVGIPPSLRGMMWQIFSKSRDSNELECEYRELLKRTSPHEKIIRRDLARTFPTHPFFQEKDGEGQQMLFNMPDEAVFCVLVKLMSHYGLRGHFTPQMETLHERLYQFDQLLLQTLPQVHKHLETHGIKPTMYASQWFMTLFSYRCPFELVFRVFDLVFVEGSSILLNFALALMKKNQKTLLNLEFETLLEFFSNRIFDVYQDEPAAFVHDAYGFNITARQLEKISKKYAVESAKEAKLHSPEDQLRRQNAELAEKLRRMEHSFNILQDEHQDVAHQLISVKMEMAQMNDENQELRRLLGKYRSDPNFAEAAPVKTDGSDMFNRLAQKNAHLVNRNSQLEDRLLEVEATLVDYKMKQKKKINRFEAANHAQVSTDYGRNDISKQYPTRLNFYLAPPSTEITIEEFELFALDRLQGRDRRKDHISHYVLRLAYCRSEELRVWFLRQECNLFRYRFEQEGQEEKRRFLTELNLNWKILDQETKDSITPQLEKSLSYSGSKKELLQVRQRVQSETYFEVDFEKVPDLLSRRSVYIHKGKAYVPMAEQVSLVMDEFRLRLSKALEVTSKILPRMEEDDRLRPILLNVEKQYTGKSYGASNNSDGTVQASDVDGLISEHAPLCMRNLHDSLRANKHLRHGGRMQYGLFLKGIGLNIDEAILFWKLAFANLPDDKFQKEYAYNIRHNYGLEGRRLDYTPYSCMKIIQSNQPSSGDSHGCPFKHFSPENLETRLYKDKIDKPQIQEIMTLVNNRHYQLACTRHFEVTHTKVTEKATIIEHPNQYYEMSKAAAEIATTKPDTQVVTESMMDIDQ